MPSIEELRERNNLLKKKNNALRQYNKDLEEIVSNFVIMGKKLAKGKVWIFEGENDKQRKRPRKNRKIKT